MCHRWGENETDKKRNGEKIERKRRKGNEMKTNNMKKGPKMDQSW